MRFFYLAWYAKPDVSLITTSTCAVGAHVYMYIDHQYIWIKFINFLDNYAISNAANAIAANSVFITM